MIKEDLPKMGNTWHFMRWHFAHIIEEPLPIKKMNTSFHNEMFI